MTSIISTGNASVSAATSITVPLGSTPAVGELVLVFLGVSNQIVVHPPGWNANSTTSPTNALAWFKSSGLSARLDNSGLQVFYHTWNAADTGSSVTFNFVPAPTLGIGDRDLSTANAVAIALVLSASAVQETSQQETLDTNALTLRLPPVKQNNSGGFVVTAGYTNAQVTFTTSDSGATLQNSLSTASGSLYAWTNAGSVGYQPTLTSSAPGDLLGAFLTVNDATPNIYNPPVAYEAPGEGGELMYRYTHKRYYTLLNTTGTFSLVRYPSTDQLAAATKTYQNNAPITSTDYTNILNAGVGGDFRYSLTGS